MSSFKIVLIVGILFAVQTVNARPSVEAEEKSPGFLTAGGFPHEERKIEAESNSPAGGYITRYDTPHKAEGRYAAVEVNAPVVQERSETPRKRASGGVPLVPGHPHGRSETPGGFPLAPGMPSPNGHENPGKRTAEEPNVKGPCFSNDGFHNC